jgi:hypothetical protein
MFLTNSLRGPELSAGMKLLVITSLLLVIISGCTFPPKPTEPPEKPFASDGCSCWPDWNYYDCCYSHDKDYWWGGTPQERKESDLKLMKCVSEKGHTILPIFMYIGVRISGHGWLPTPFRWGFGRPWPEGYYSEPEKAEK